MIPGVACTSVDKARLPTLSILWFQALHALALTTQENDSYKLVLNSSNLQDMTLTEMLYSTACKCQNAVEGI